MKDRPRPLAPGTQPPFAVTRPRRWLPRALLGSLVATLTLVGAGITLTSTADPTSAPVVAAPPTTAPAPGLLSLDMPDYAAEARVNAAADAQAQERREARHAATRARQERLERRAAAAQAQRRTHRLERRAVRIAARIAARTAPLGVAIAHANIPSRSSEGAYRSTLAAMTAQSPDFLTLNEQSARSLAFIESAAPGYTAWREDTVEPADAGQRNQALGTVVAWKSDAYTALDVGRVKMVDNDHTSYEGHPVVWDRFATWALLKRTSDGAVMSVVSVHHMTNPAKYGPNLPARQAKYERGMNTLLGLTRSLSEHGPVIVGGDFNTHAGQHQPWTAVSAMAPAGYRFANTGVDYIFYPDDPRLIPVEQVVGPTPEPDHQWLYVRFA